MSKAYVYDVAFSFLGKDEALAVQLNDLLEDRLATFIYSDPERQARLAGRDGGEAFGRVFGVEARTVAVLYREGWGDQGFTAVEATAIRNRAHEVGWDFTTFIPLDDPPTAPVWLPRTRLWAGLKRWELESVATVIESRVQESGGNPRTPTVAEAAERAVREIQVADERRCFLDSGQGVEAAQREFNLIYGELQRVSGESSGIIGGLERTGNLVRMTALRGARSIAFAFEVQFWNTLQNAKLRVIEFDGTSTPSETNRSEDSHFDFGPAGDQGWRKGTKHFQGKFFTTPRLVDEKAKKLIEAVRVSRTKG